MKKYLLILFVASVAIAQLEMPSIGTMRDGSGAWRAVYGVAGSFLLGPVTAEPKQIALEDALAALGVTLSSTADELVLRRADANEIRFPLANVTAMRVMSAEYVQVSSGGLEYVLWLNAGKEALYLLPAVQE